MQSDIRFNVAKQVGSLPVLDAPLLIDGVLLRMESKRFLIFNIIVRFIMILVTII